MLKTEKLIKAANDSYQENIKGSPITTRAIGELIIEVFKNGFYNGYLVGQKDIKKKKTTTIKAKK